MYHFNTSTFRPPQHRNDQAVFRHSGSSTAHHPVVTPALRSSVHHRPPKATNAPVEEEKEDYYEAPGIFRTSTANDCDDDFEIKRTGSGGLFMKKRSNEERDEISRAKANQMCVVFELSDVWDELNKNASLKLKHKPRETTFAPSLRTISVQQAVEEYVEQEMSYNENKMHDPLVSKREIQKAQKKVEKQKKRKEKLKKRTEKEGKSSSLRSRLPLMDMREKMNRSKQHEARKVTKKAKPVKETFPHEESEVTPTGGSESRHLLSNTVVVSGPGHDIESVYDLRPIC